MPYTRAATTRDLHSHGVTQKHTHTYLPKHTVTDRLHKTQTNRFSMSLPKPPTQSIRAYFDGLADSEHISKPSIPAKYKCTERFDQQTPSAITHSNNRYNRMPSRAVTSPSPSACMSVAAISKSAQLKQPTLRKSFRHPVQMDT